MLSKVAYLKKEYFVKTEHIGFSYWSEADLELANQLWGEQDVTQYICETGKFTQQNIIDRLNIEV